VNGVVEALARPVDGLLRIAGRVRPEWLWSRLDRRARRRGFKRLRLALSFDCDTAEDAAVVLDLDRRLRDRGLLPAYAVPAALIEREENIYGELRRRGAEFLNHGYVQHTAWNSSLSRYESTFFYETLSRNRVAQDIQEGRDALGRLLGVAPDGFRTPHFGTFQRPEQIRFLHAELARSGHRYSSSTVPAFAFRHGPVFERSSVLEFPVTGTYTRPLMIQDSWAFYAAPDRTHTAQDYLTEARSLVRYVEKHGLVGVLNYYADPSHVWNQPTFFEAIDVWRRVAEPATFSELCRE
jgi:peptidoglycan/xylan/chitin deacetylase (PgdA/CDA1 family)